MELMRVILERAMTGHTDNDDLDKRDALAVRDVFVLCCSRFASQTVSKFGEIVNSYSRPYLMAVVVRFYGCPFCARLVYSIEKSLVSQ